MFITSVKCAPLSMSLPECILAGIAGRSARQFFPAVRGVLRIEEARATAGDHALGAWVPPRHQAARGAASVAMAVGYGGTEPQLAAAAATRLSVVETFRAWLGDRFLEDAVPLCARACRPSPSSFQPALGAPRRTPALALQPPRRYTPAAVPTIPMGHEPYYLRAAANGTGGRDSFFQAPRSAQRPTVG